MNPPPSATCKLYGCSYYGDLDGFAPSSVSGKSEAELGAVSIWTDANDSNAVPSTSSGLDLLAVQIRPWGHRQVLWMSFSSELHELTPSLGEAARGDVSPIPPNDLGASRCPVRPLLVPCLSLTPGIVSMSVYVRMRLNLLFCLDFKTL